MGKTKRKPAAASSEPSEPSERAAATTATKDSAAAAEVTATVELVEVTANGRTLKFRAGVNAEFVLATAASEFGPCVHKPARLRKDEVNFDAEARLAAGVYTYEPCFSWSCSESYSFGASEKWYFHPTFGHLVTPSPQDFNTTRMIQQDPRLRSLNFRPAGAAPFLPLQLVHVDFARFLDDIRSGDLQPTQADYDFFVRLVEAASEMLDEPELKGRVTELCREYFTAFEIIDEMNTGILKARDGRGTATDVGARSGNAIVLLTEIKKAISGTGADPQMQGICNYKLHWTTRRPLAAASFGDTAYPAFLLELVGQWLKIGGLVTLGDRPGSEFGGKVCYQPLASVDLYAINRHDLTTAEQGVKVLMAFKKALESLKRYYLELAGTAFDPMLEKLIHSRKLPYLLHPYGDKVEQIGDRLVYVVKGGLSKDHTGDYMVKFVQGYGTQVHKAWGDAGFAPTLEVVVKAPGGGWKWLAMELLKEEDGWKCLEQLDAKVANGLRPQVLEFLDKAHKVQVLFKDGNLAYGVHGDMRDANVMVLLDGDEELKDVKFIDFDWAKVQGEDNAIYPGFMNPRVNWPAGVEAGKPMLQEHDRSLLRLARGQQLKDLSSLENRKRPKMEYPSKFEYPEGLGDVEFERR